MTEVYHHHHHLPVTLNEQSSKVLAKGPTSLPGIAQLMFISLCQRPNYDLLTTLHLYHVDISNSFVSLVSLSTCFNVDNANFMFSVEDWSNAILSSCTRFQCHYKYSLLFNSLATNPFPVVFFLTLFLSQTLSISISLLVTARYLLLTTLLSTSA